MTQVKQVTDKESVELGTTLQLSPHSPTDKVNTVDRKDIKENPKGEYISLDDVYETTGQESFQVLAANCREFVEHRRLHGSAFAALGLTGFESMMPGFDRFNAVKGGEGFVDSLKKGFVALIKGAKRFILAVIDWVIMRVKAMLGFTRSARDLEIVAEHSSEAKRLLAEVMQDLAKEKNINFDVTELYAALPQDVESKVAFRIVKDNNKSLLDQVGTLSKAAGEIIAVQNQVNRVSQLARTAKSRYEQAVGKLKAAHRSGGVDAEVIAEFKLALEKEILETLNLSGVRSSFIKLIDKIYSIKLTDSGLDKAFKDEIRKYREQISAMESVKVSAADYEAYREASKALPRKLVEMSEAQYDANVISYLKDIVDVKDAELISAITDNDMSASPLLSIYTSYTGSISEYVATIEHMLNILNSIRGSIANIVGWANGIDRLMTGYIANDIKMIKEAEGAYLSKDAIKEMAIKDEKGNQVGSKVNIDYDRLFTAKFGGLLNQVTPGYMAEYIREKYKMIGTINEHLKAIGVPVRI